MGCADEGPKQKLPHLVDAGFITELTGLSSFLESQGDIEQGLKEWVVMVSALLRCENCSIMLLKEEDSQQDHPKLRVYAHHGHLPEAAYHESISLNQGIAGKVAATGESLLIREIQQSSYASLTKRVVAKGGFVSVPIVIGDKIVGVLNASRPCDNRELSQEDLSQARIVALMVGKSLQVFQLQHLLRSNFIQLSLAREIGDTPQQTINAIVSNGMKMSKILAKTFFREMRDSGFGNDHILSAATEIIHMLGSEWKGGGDPRAGEIKTK